MEMAYFERGFNKVELLLNMTIGGTVTACMLLLIKMLLKNKLTPKWHFYLWIILMIRLLIPGLPESDISLLNHIPVTQVSTTADSTAAGNLSNEAETGYVEGSLVMKSPITGIEQKRAFSVPEQRVNIMLYGWMVGVVLMAVYLAGAYGVFNHRTKKLALCEDAEILKLLQHCKDETGITAKNITLRSGGTTPMLQGILKPTILIPEGYSREELRHILIHELCHYKHKDIMINMICCGFLCVYWFNPIIWLCFYMIRRDLEILCDERAIEITGERKEYAKTLLRTALKRNQFLFATTSMQNGEKEVAKRIKHIAYFKRPKLWISVLAICVVLVTGLVCLTDASISNTVNKDVGNGYFMKIPENWIQDKGELLFYNKEGENIGGVNMSQVDSGDNTIDNFDTLRPNHSLVLERKVLKEGDNTIIIVNLDFDTETAAQIAERNAAGDNSPSKKINQNYIFLMPDKKEGYVYSIWADSSEVTESKLLKIARTLQKDPDPQGYQPEATFKNDWSETANALMNQYLKSYVDADMAMSSDISGYRIDNMEQYADQDASWSVIYPNAAVFQVDYTLNIVYPNHYSFAGGGFQIGEGNKTKIFKDQLAVFQKDGLGKAKFLGFVWQQDIGKMGEAMAVLRTIGYTDSIQSPAALLELKMPYIGDHSRVGKILRSLPLSGYSKGLELNTKAEPYGLTVNYDMTELGDEIFKSRPDRLPTDSSGWDPNPYLQAQLDKNSAILLSLIDNCATVELKITGMSEFGVPYTYYYLRDREALTKELSRDPRKYTESLESFNEFFYNLEKKQLSIVQTGNQ